MCSIFFDCPVNLAEAGSITLGEHIELGTFYCVCIIYNVQTQSTPFYCRLLLLLLCTYNQVSCHWIIVMLEVGPGD